VACVILAVLAAGCGGGSGSGGASGPATQADLLYGRGAPRSPAGITYQPDVVVVDGGSQAIKAQSGDGVTWTLNGNAGHVGDLTVGSVLYLTSFAAGRVAKLDHAGSDVVVTLAPIDITDVIRDGTIDMKQSLDPSTMVLRPMPELVDALDFTATGESTPSPTAPDILPRRALLADAAAMPPPTTGSKTGVTVGPFAIDMGRSGKEISAKITYTKNGVTFVAEEEVEMEDNPSAESHLEISGGKIHQGKALFSGIKSLTTHMTLGSETGLKGNFKSQIEFPVEMDIPLAVGPVPFNLAVQFKSILQTAFSAKNSTIEASAKMDVKGALGFETTDGKTTVMTPEVAVTELPIDTAQGVSVGVNGAIFAIQLKCLYGLGTEAVSVGPFVALTVSMSATIGSDLGIVKCRQASLDVVAAGGAGFKISPIATKFFEGIIPESLKSKFKLESDFASVTQQLVHKSWAKPPVAACK
jgi:hypothetical protein